MEEWEVGRHWGELGKARLIKAARSQKGFWGVERKYSSKSKNNNGGF